MKKNRCKECGEKMFYRWEKDVNGNKTVKRRDGANYYKASCPLCGCSWFIRKKEDRVYHDYGQVAS